MILRQFLRDSFVLPIVPKGFCRKWKWNAEKYALLLEAADVVAKGSQIQTLNAETLKQFFASAMMG